MKKRITMAGLLVIGFAALSVLLAAGSGQIAKKEILKSDVLRQICPDILVESINFSASVSGKTVILTVTGDIYNDSPVHSWVCPTEAGKAAWTAQPSANCQFKWKKYVRSYPNGRWAEIGTAVSTMLNAGTRANYNFTDTMPMGAQREYKIVLDTENWLRETDKNNNTKTKIYTAGK